MRIRMLTAGVATTAAALVALTGGASGAVVAVQQPAPTGRVVCAPGQLPEHDTSLAAFAAGQVGSCRSPLAIEDPAEKALANGQLQMRHEGVYPVLPDAFPAAHAQAERIARASSGAEGSWIPVGKGPELFDVAGYNEVNGEGLHTAAGRIQGFDRDPSKPNRWFAAVASGGVYETTDAGAHWRSIGESLPTQIVGYVAYTKAGGGTLVAGTGDPAYGGSSIAGLGIFWSNNDGKSWHKSTGSPSGTITFRVAVDPSNNKTVYAATGKGLWRSTNAGRSFTNVKLPTGCTNIKKPTCFFANMVTDVLVRPGRNANGTGSGGGQVLAAVGWRAGQKLNAQGTPQSPHNGLYYSKTGKPGTFTFRTNPAPGNATGFAADDVVGRTALGMARGSRQNHDFIYALVQDTKKFNDQTIAGPVPNPGGAYPGNTVLDGIYASKDFGATWVKMADAEQLKNPTNGSALNGPLGATYSPGVQSWYNEWIDVDPSRTAEDGTPQRLLFGLEEVWQGDAAVPTAPGTSQFKVIGQYFAGDSCAGLTLNVAGYCPTNAEPTQKVSNFTTHPDQHAVMFVPDSKGGVTLVVGNDGGAYKQHVAAGVEFDNYHWGKGINQGMQTLLPYYASMAKDGTVVAGLQDNGNIKIDPDTQKVIATYGGDGFFSFVDPDKSNVQYEEYVGGSLHVSTDGGRSWSTIDPVLTSPMFSTPFTMDETNSNHLVIGGREIFETLQGPKTTSPTDPSGTVRSKEVSQVFGTSTDWIKVFDLGTAQHPGDATASADPVAGLPVAPPTRTETNLQESAVDTRGNATYVGWCGFCDIVTGGVPFKSGIATNVGGSVKGKAGTPAGWHIAKAKGLPQRIINNVTIDPKDAKTVYVTLGGYGRRWIPPGSLGDSVSKVGKGHVYVSHNAGASFTDISGNLPDITANWVLKHGKRLIVATDLGVFISSSLKGGTYTKLGKGLPNAATFSLAHSPRNPNEIVAATQGRGVYRIVLKGKAAVKSRKEISGTPAGAAVTPALPATAPARTTVSSAKASTIGDLNAHLAALPAQRKAVSGGLLAVALGALCFPLLTMAGTGLAARRRRATS